MTIEDIKKALESGEYRIKHEEDCCCSFNWELSGDELIDNASGDECWEGNILYVGDTAIAQAIRFDRIETLIDGLNLDDIDEDILDAMRMSDILGPGESSNNDRHEERRRDELIDYLMECGYILDEDEERGFANEYTMILREPEEGGEEVTTTREEAEKWADSYLYCGDAATEAFNGFRFEARRK